MSSSDVGPYEFKRSSCEMHMDECSATLARSTSDGSADNDDSHSDSDSNNDNDNSHNDSDNPPTHRWSSVLGVLNILPFASHMVTAGTHMTSRHLNSYHLSSNPT